ncbi:MAG: hydrogenase expression/formation protein HypE [Nitrososphaerota archaeon]|nr:hydrogenase expression/formation protein HypE [Nitrososphaerales archaeon]MDW8044780.1 hydrogenase expression/formation protein HypE [Nitrososphaerota archaeon]
MSDRITMAHGAGGSVMQSLIKQVILRLLGGSGAEVPLEALDDAAVVDGIVLKTDSHTVKPLFFPGGDIGRLAVSGTINDICMLGAEPIALASGFILEEGFPLSDFIKIVESMRDTCREAGVYIITGDTKVVEKGALDRCVINTSGIGRRSELLDRNIDVVRRYRPFNSRWLLDSNLRSGDKIILSGAIGDHGIAVLSSREGYGFESKVLSDVKPLNKVVKKILEVGGLVALKDPTRGGLANALNEWCEKSKVGILIEEDKVPIHDGVRAACEMLGIDPYEIGNEGKMIIGVVKEKADEVLAALRETEEGKEAEIIGEATDEFSEVVLRTRVGGMRIIPPPIGDPVPRIC